MLNQFRYLFFIKSNLLENFTCDIAIIETKFIKINATTNCTLYSSEIAKIASIMDAPINAILGFVNIDNIIINAGIGKKYVEKPGE